MDDPDAAEKLSLKGLLELERTSDDLDRFLQRIIPLLHRMFEVSAKGDGEPGPTKSAN
jgi:hypothetical protein